MSYKRPPRGLAPLLIVFAGGVLLCACGYDFDAPFALSAWTDASADAGGGPSDAASVDGADVGAAGAAGVAGAGGTGTGGSGGFATGGTGGTSTGGTGGTSTGGTGGTSTGGTGGTSTGGTGGGFGGTGGAEQDACVPATCASLNMDCGEGDDGCGTTLDCGTCLPNQSCIDNGSMSYCCTPLTCSDLNATCGDWPDECGGTVSCGSCTPPSSCVQDYAGASCQIECTMSDPLVDSCTQAADWTCRGDCDLLLADTVVDSLSECESFCVAQNANCCLFAEPTCSECSSGGNCGAFSHFDTTPHTGADNYILCLD